VAFRSTFKVKVESVSVWRAAPNSGNITVPLAVYGLKVHHFFNVRRAQVHMYICTVGARVPTEGAGATGQAKHQKREMSQQNVLKYRQITVDGPLRTPSRYRTEFGPSKSNQSRTGTSQAMINGMICQRSHPHRIHL
jgi:hypothetical protein